MVSLLKLFFLFIMVVLVPSNFLQGQILEEKKGIRLEFQIALVDEMPIVSTEILDEWVARTNQIFQEIPLQFLVGNVVPLPEDVKGLVTRKDRNQLAEITKAADQMIQVFVVPNARDVDKLNGWIAGVHWRYGGSIKSCKSRRYIIISLEHTNADTLPHELGHWFGLSHVLDIDNLMFGDSSRTDTKLTSVQMKRIASVKADAITSGEIAIKERPVRK